MKNQLPDIVDKEMQQQDKKWGADRHQEPLTWLAILTEEIGEIAQAILHDQHGGNHAGTLEIELVQAIAVGLQWLKDIGHDCNPGYTITMIETNPSCPNCGHKRP